MNYSSKSFLETKKFQTLTIENQNQINIGNLKSVPFLCKGSGCFNKLVVFKEGFILGNNNLKLEGNIKYENENFYGYNGTDWIPFNAEQIWEKSENNISINNKKLGIGKLNPKKLLDIAGDVQIDKKLSCNETATFDQGICVKPNKVKKIPGTIRFFENSFQGYDGENWIDFGNSDEFVLKVDQESNVLQDDILKFKDIVIDTLNLGENVKFESQNNKLVITTPCISVSNTMEFKDGITIKKRKIVNIDEPENDGDVVTKRYVDNALKGLKSQLMADYFFEKEVSFEIDENEAIILLKNNELFIIEKGNKLSLTDFPLKVLVNKGKYEGKEIIFYKKDDLIAYHISGHITPNNFGKIFSIEKGNNINIRLGSTIEEDIDGLNIKDRSISNRYLDKNSIKTDNLLDNIVTTEKIANKSIEASKIKNYTISAEHLKDNIISAKHLQNGIIQSRHIGPNGISTNNLCPELISSIHLKSGIIVNDHLGKGIISSDNLKNEIVESCHLKNKVIGRNHLSEKIVNAEHIQNSSIGEIHLKEKIILGKHLNEKIITEKHLDNNIISGDHICKKQIKSIHLAPNSIREENIAEGQIDKIHLKQDIISSEELEADSVDIYHLKDYCVDGSKIGKRAILSEHLTESIINGDHLMENIINANHLQRNIIDESHLSNNIIKTHHLSLGSITEQKLQEESITNRKIKDKTIQNNKIKTPYLNIVFDEYLSGNNQVNLGETLKIGVNNNYYLPRKQANNILMEGNIKVGEEDTKDQMVVNNEVVFNGKVDFTDNRVMPIGSVLQFLKNIKVDTSKYLKLDGSEITKIKYPELFNLMKNNDKKIILPKIDDPVFDFYLVV